MNILDMRTVFLSSVISYGICLVVIVFLWQQHHRRSPELGFWMADFILQDVSMLLIFFRGILPDFISIVLANILVILGTIFLLIGLERYVGRIRSHWHNALLLLVFSCVHVYFTFIQPSLSARNINASVALVLICFQGSWLMLRGVDKKLRLASRSVGIVFFLYGVVGIARVILNLFEPMSNDLFKSGLTDVLVILIYQMMFIALTFALLLMVNRRLFSDLESDIVERELAEEARKISEEKFAVAFQFVPDVITLTKMTDGTIVEVNQSFYRTSGYSNEEVIGKTTFELNLWNIPADRASFIDQLLVTSNVGSIETTFRRKSGDIFPAIVSGAMINLRGEPYVLTVIHDNTERKKSEAALKRRNDYLAALQETTYELITQLDIHKLLENITIRPGQLLQTSGCFLDLVDFRTNELIPHIGTGVLTASLQHQVSLGEGVAGIVWQTAKPLVINNYDLWSGRIKGYSTDTLNAVVGVPLVSNGGVLGVLGLAYDFESRKTFSSESVDYLTQFAQLAAIAIVNASLYTEAQNELAERRQVETALQKSEERMGLVLQGANDGWWDWDLANNQIFYSPRWWSMLGYEPDELESSLTLNQTLTHPGDQTHVETIMRQALQDGPDQYEVEFRLLHKQGFYVPVLSRGYIQRDENHQPVRITGTNTDLTVRKQTEEDLRLSEERLRLAMTASQMGAWDRNFITGELECSVEFKNMFGISSETQLIDEILVNQVHPDDREKELQMIDEALVNQKNYRAEFRVVWQDQSIHWIEALGHGYYDKEGRVVRMAGVTLNITARKQIDEQLRESRDYFENLVNFANAPVVVWNANYEITLFNQAFERLTGWSESEVIGKNIGLIFPAVERARSLEYIASASSGKRWEVLEINIQQIDGTVSTLLWNSAVVYAPDGKSVLATIAQGQDITDRIKAEGQIRQLNSELEERVRDRTAQLETANKELEAFAYSVSHDLRAPLRALAGFSAELIADYQDQLDNQGQHYLERIQAASLRMGQLIDDLLNLSRVTRCELHRESINLSVLAQEIADDLKNQEPQRFLEFEITKDIVIQADPHLMKIAFENLLSNACKFTSHSDHAVIQVGEIEANGERVYYVRDNGVGFDMAYVGKLFIPFQRLHGMEEFPGTGIGLVIVQRIITRQGGRLWPEAAVNQGAAFYFTLGGA